MVDWILETTFITILGVILLIGFIILYRRNRQVKSKILLLLGIFYLFGTIECIFRGIEGFSAIFAERLFFFYFLGKWTIVVRTLCLIAIFELMSRESVRKEFIGVWAFLSAILIVLDNIWYFGGANMGFVSTLLDAISDWAYFLLVSTILFGVRVAYKIFANAPPALKKQARIFFIGFTIVGIANPLFELDRIIPQAPTRYPAGLFMGLGILIITMVLYLSPQLAYILPFKVLRLTVMDVESGLALYSHTWEAGNKIVDEDLFTGMLQGIRNIIKESMQQGNLKEIKTDNAVVLILKQNALPLLFFLVSTVASQILRNSLDVFSREFIGKFGQFYNKQGNVAAFRDADVLTQKLFNYT